MYNNFIDKYSDLKRVYVNLMKDSKRIYDEMIPWAVNIMRCALYMMKLV